ncbi:hypothetical protein B7P43_G07988 [Cryptotermes secundus]|uniref:Uncharacterized protein n=2 Tax=Cryptotermes secundus TaxID=105785 RepID=A0A2J7PHS2_9NEOP|nr:hypothetical protein B7P43_G07988 [Cryptotermes secundus]
MQSQSETNERITCVSSNSDPELETLENSTICDTACKPQTLPEKLNNTLSNIRKIKDRNTCEVVEHQREVTQRKTHANKKSKRKSGLSSSSNEAVEVESDTGILKKKTIMKEEIESVKIPSTVYNQVSMETSDVGQSNDKLRQSNSLKQRFLFTEDLCCKTPDDSDNMQACITVKNITDETPYNKQTLSSSKLSSCTFQKLQKFKRTISITDSVPQTIPENKGNLFPVDEILDCKTDSSTQRIIRQSEALDNLVNYGKKLSNSQRSSISGSTPSDKTVTKASQNNSQVFSAGGYDLGDLDFEI